MIPFLQAFDATPGRPERLSPLVRRVLADNPGPFTYTGTGTYLVGPAEVGATVAIIDPGPDDAAHLKALLAAVRGQTVSHILLTHSHRDHAPLARPLADIVAAPVLAATPPHSRTHASDAGHDMAADEPPVVELAADGFLTDQDRIAGDGWTLEVLATPGHASDHLAFALIEENGLFSGDHVMGWSTTVVAPPDGDMAAYLASLDKVIARDFQTIWPAHGPPISDPRNFLAAYRQHRLTREAQIIDRLRAGDGQIPHMVRSLYATTDPRLWPAASLSVWAHLIKLVREGRVRADPAPTLAAVYGLTDKA